MATLVMIEVDEILAAVMLASKMESVIPITTKSQNSGQPTSLPSCSTATGDSVPKEGDVVPTKTESSDETTAGKQVVPKKKKKVKPRVLKEEVSGIYTIQHLEAANFIGEWYKGFSTTAPYILRLMKTYWSLSPVRASLLIGTNLLSTVLPSLELWVSKSLLDQVNEAVKGSKPKLNKLLGLALIALGTVVLEHGVNVVSYFLISSFSEIRDKIDQVMNRKMSKLLDTQLIEAHLRLDPDQIASRKIYALFQKGRAFTNSRPAEHIDQLAAFARYVLIIASSSYALSRMMPKHAGNLILLSGIKALAHIYRLLNHYTDSKRYQITNQAWHRLDTIKDFTRKQSLRRDIRATGLEGWLLSEIHTANAELGDTPTGHPGGGKASSKVSFARYVFVNIIRSLEYIWLIYEGLGKGISLGTLDLLRTHTNQLVDRMWNLMWSAESATRDWKTLVAFYECLEVKPEMARPENPKDYVSNSEGMKIEARDLRYKYDAKKEEEVLKGVSFVIKPGEMIAVVGFNGAGKSTLAKLLMRLADVTGGELLVNDINVKEYDPDTLRHHIAVLFQDIGKYWGITLHENIQVGQISNADGDAIHQSAADAGAAEFIEELPYKYDSFVGHVPGSRSRSFGFGRWDDSSDSEDESEEKKEVEKRVTKNLSGGQWQKIALARAFMRGNQADLLVLDEPTANLDPEAEYMLFETIKRLRKGRTTVYISHRFNTVRAADRIMVLEKGQVAEFGTHDELMSLESGRYHRLYSLQAKGFQFDDDGAVSKDIDGIKVEVKEEVVKSIVQAQNICNSLPN